MAAHVNTAAPQETNRQDADEQDGSQQDANEQSPSQPGATAQAPAQPGASTQATGQAAGNRLWTKDFVFGTLVNFLLMVNYYSLMVVITSYSMKVYNAPASAAGLAASIFIIGALIARIIAGSVMDKVGRKHILVAGILVEVACSALYLLGIGFAPLFVLRFAHGFAYGCCSTTIGTVVTALVPAKRKGEGVGYYMLSTTLGAAIGPFLGMFLSQNVGYPVLFITAVAVAVVGMLFILSLKVPEISRKRAASSAASALAADKTAQASGRKSHKAAQPSRQIAGEAAGAHRSMGWVSKIIEPSAVSIGLMCGVLFFCYSSLLTFLTPFAEENGLTTASSFFFVAYAAATFITRPFTGKQFDRKGDQVVMVPAFIAFTIGMALLSNVHHPVVMLVAAALMGYGAGTVQSSALALAVRMAPPEKLSLANSTFYALLDVGVGVGPLVLGIVEPFWGYRGLFLAMAILSVVSFAMYLYIGRKGGSMRRLLKEHS